MLGFEYDDTKTSEGRPFTREDLDAAAPQHPVCISHRGGHTAYVRASGIFDEAIGANYSRADYREAVKPICKMMSRAGITSAHHAWGVHDYLRGYQDAHDAGELSTRIYCLIHYSEMDRMLAAGIRTGFGNEWIRVGGMKMVADGSISERTA